MNLRGRTRPARNARARDLADPPRTYEGALAVIEVRDAATVEKAIRGLGAEGHRALADGRVFVGARRVSGSREPVGPGAKVIVYAARPIEEPARILAERDGVLAAYKPAGMSTIPDQRGIGASLLGAIASLTGTALPIWHPTSRLDLGVSGVVLFAAGERARRRLSEARARGFYRRRYVGIATHAPHPDQGIWTAPIGRARDPRLRVAGGLGAVHASTGYLTVALGVLGGARPASGATPDGRSDGRPALLALAPLTGRTHQIRVHAATASAPLFGDSAYGGPTRIISANGAVRALGRIALHAAWVEVPDAAGKAFRFDAPVPGDLAALWETLGGSGDAWLEAVSVSVEEPDVGEGLKLR